MASRCGPVAFQTWQTNVSTNRTHQDIPRRLIP
jgi:hypothetical protein